MAFANPIVAGGALIIPAIFSPDFVTSGGTTGWSINKDGTATFNNGLIRGTVVVGTPATGFVTITQDPTFGPVVIWTDTTGQRWMARATVAGNSHNFVLNALDSNVATALGLGYDNTTNQSVATMLATRWNVNATADTPTEWTDITGNCFINGVTLGIGGELLVLARHSGRRCELSISWTIGAGGSVSSFVTIDLPTVPWDFTAHNYGIYSKRWTGSLAMLDSSAARWYVGTTMLTAPPGGGTGRNLNFLHTENLTNGRVANGGPFTWASPDEAAGYLAYDLANVP